MDSGTSSSTLPVAPKPSRHRKQRISDDSGVRYFLPATGTSPSAPELGQELAGEGEALIEAFRSGQPFYTLATWKAVPEVDGRGSPMIVKLAVAPKQVQS